MRNLLAEEDLGRFVKDIISSHHTRHPWRAQSIMETFVLLLRRLDGTVDLGIVDRQYFSPAYRFLAQQPTHSRTRPEVLRQFAVEYSKISRRSRLRYLRWQRSQAKEELNEAINRSLVVKIAILRTGKSSRIREMDCVKSEEKRAADKFGICTALCWDAFGERKSYRPTTDPVFPDTC